MRHRLSGPPQPSKKTVAVAALALLVTFRTPEQGPALLIFTELGPLISDDIVADAAAHAGSDCK
jgi:hypothetical protein